VVSLVSGAARSESQSPRDHYSSRQRRGLDEAFCTCFYGVKMRATMRIWLDADVGLTSRLRSWVSITSAHHGVEPRWALR
jgi:hypothetical protein